MLVVPSSVADRVQIKSMIQEITAGYAKIEAEREHIKEVLDAIQEKFEIKKKIISKIAKIMYKGTFSDVEQEHEAFCQLYETLVNSSGKSNENNE